VIGTTTAIVATMVAPRTDETSVRRNIWCNSSRPTFDRRRPGPRP
jgi:hypothetical protein